MFETRHAHPLREGGERDWNFSHAGLLRFGRPRRRKAAGTVVVSGFDSISKNCGVMSADGAFHFEIDEPFQLDAVFPSGTGGRDR
jgi:hypothetical protein